MDLYFAKATVYIKIIQPGLAITLGKQLHTAQMQQQANCRQPALQDRHAQTEAVQISQSHVQQTLSAEPTHTQDLHSAMETMFIRTTQHTHAITLDKHPHTAQTQQCLICRQPALQDRHAQTEAVQM